jgi:hypothetical protein
MPVAPFYAYHDPDTGDFYQAPEAQATHYFDGAQFHRYTPGGSPPIAPTQAGAVPPVTGLAPTGPQQPQTPEDYRSFLRQALVSQLMPLWQNAMLTGVGGLQSLANASPQAVLQATGTQTEPAIQQAQLQRQQASQALGPSGGRQIRRTGGDLNTQLARLLAGIFAQAPGQARQGLSRVAGDTSLLIPQAPQTRTGIGRQEVDPSAQSIATGLMGGIGLGKGLYRLLSPLWPSSVGLPPYPPDVTPQTTGPFEGVIY